MSLDERGTLPPRREPDPKVVAIRREIEERAGHFEEAATYVKQMPEGLGDDLYRQLKSMAWAYKLAALIVSKHQFPRVQGIG